MEDLKNMMDTLPIAEINQQIRQFVHSADGYDNKLKVTFVLLNLIQEAAQLLGSVDSNEFISEVRKRVDELDKQSTSLAEAYHTQMAQNDEIVDMLSDNTNNRIADIQDQIGVLLREYDNIVRMLVEVRDRLPIEKQLEEENKRS